MLLWKTFYVSTATSRGDMANAALMDIAATSLVYNRVHDVTGTLIFSGEHFAQIIEGPQTVIRNLMGRIYADTRHHDLHIASDCECRERAFPTWNVGFSQSSHYVGEQIRGVLDGRFAAGHDRLEQFMRGMARA